MDRQFRVAVIGATGLVGETLIAVPDEHGLRFDVRLQAGPDGQAETVFLQYRIGGS